LAIALCVRAVNATACARFKGRDAPLKLDCLDGPPRRLDNLTDQDALIGTQRTIRNGRRDLRGCLKHTFR
jgi:hypothetical protein